MNSVTAETPPFCVGSPRVFQPAAEGHQEAGGEAEDGHCTGSQPCHYPCGRCWTAKSSMCHIQGITGLLMAWLMACWFALFNMLINCVRHCSGEGVKAARFKAQASISSVHLTYIQKFIIYISKHIRCLNLVFLK